ncbi:10674_t:CDS:2 [Diversispora eburnea]|uniref:10674_t:CDS:1 n=1 Tax=Diversispora eburnea TaxID=1213867 RepID=A0A9N8ZK01_9GLOM|nr:10674_t:CDS:2 [Diversispora eburnea]
MATKISTELLIMILNNVQSTQDLYSSFLVNRFWCKVTVPILWELPLGQECCTDDKKLRKKALCIRTYISCMNTHTRTLLTQNGLDLSSSPPQTTFDYPSFTHKFIVNNLVNFISKYLPQIIDPDQDNCNIGDETYEEIVINKSRILFSEICKLIIDHCTYLDSFEMTGAKCFSRNFLDYGDLIGSIFKLSGASKVFKKLESFTSTIENNEQIYPLYESLKLICDNILNMDLKLDLYFQVQLLAELISAQKRLENLSIGAKYYQDYNSIFRAIISQKETLKCLRLNFLIFHHFERKSSPIGRFTSLQELYIEDCHGLHKWNCLSLAAAFTQLSSFHFIYTYKGYPQKFIVKILETANENLRNIRLSLYDTIPFDIFSAILNYCTNITELTLLNLSSEQVIAIFNNNFNELRNFSFDCGMERIDADKLLCQMAKNVPESLETIEIRMNYYNPWIFSADDLRKFFEGWCRKGREGNKKIIVKRSEQLRRSRFKLSDEHFKVIKEYGLKSLYLMN